MQPLGPAHLLDPKEAQRLNLSVLKRIDSATEQVLGFGSNLLVSLLVSRGRWEEPLSSQELIVMNIQI